MSVKQLTTAEELWVIPDEPGKRFELVEGEVTEVPSAGALHAMIVALLYRLLDDYARQRDLGLVLPDGLAYVLRRNPDQLRIPDVSFIAWDLVPEEGVPEGFWKGAPTLAVEVVSPNDRAEDIHARVQDYLDAGSRQVWVLWPRNSSMSIHHLGADTRNLLPDDMLDGGDILPGFSARVSDLFEVRRRK